MSSMMGFAWGAVAGGFFGSLVGSGFVASAQAQGLYVPVETANAMMAKCTAGGVLLGIAGSIDQELENMQKDLKKDKDSNDG